MARAVHFPRTRVVSNSIRVLPGAKVFLYEPGTTTPLVSYADAALTTAQTHPVVADAYGVFPAMYLSDEVAAYKLRLTNNAGSEIWTEDNIPTSANNAGGQYPLSEQEATVGITEKQIDSAYPPGHVRRYGATGSETDVTTATPAFEAALSTGHAVTGQPGDIYWIDPLVADVPNVVIDMTGCELKLLRQYAALPDGNYMLTVTGEGVLVRGGTWNGTKDLAHANNDAYYAYAAVMLNADNVTVENIWSKDSKGIGIKGGPADGHVVRNCRVTGYNVQGIFLQNGSTEDHVDWVVEGNYIEMDVNTGVGIYLQAPAPYTYVPKRWVVSRNIVVGPSSNSKADIDFCSTLFGSDGVVSDNTFYGGTCGVSAVRTDNSSFTGNRFIDQNIDRLDRASFGLEISGGGNTVTGNVFVGGNQGIAMNLLRTSDYNTVTGNLFRDQKPTTGQGGIGVLVYAIGNEANYTNVSNNTFTATQNPWVGVYLAGACKSTLVSGNQFAGPVGANTAGVYFADGWGRASIVNNRFGSVERPVILYSSVALDYEYISCVGNDCSFAVNDPAIIVALDGSAAYGSGISVVNNAVGGVDYDYLDRKNNIVEMWRSGDPEGTIVAGVGSIYHRLDGGSGTCLYIKEVGTDENGWAAK